jgi:hypothetical protein
MKNYFVIANVLPGKLNAAIKNIMKQIGVKDPNEAVRMLNAGELQISIIKSEWHEKDGVIYFTVTSDGTTGEEWGPRLKSKGSFITDYTNSVLCSKNFQPTKPTFYKVAVLKGEIFDDSERITKKIRQEARKQKLLIPNAELAPLIREKFSDKELEAMGLYRIVVMHESIKDSGGDTVQLSANRNDNDSWLDTRYDNHDDEWDCSDGFAFVVSQVELGS